MPHNLIPGQENPVTLPKFQMIRRLVMSSGSKNKEPRYICLSTTEAPHSHKTWTEVSSSSPLLLHRSLLTNPIKWRGLRRNSSILISLPLTAVYKPIFRCSLGAASFFSFLQVCSYSSFYGNRVGSILSTWPYQISCFPVISSNIVSCLFVFSLI